MRRRRRSGEQQFNRQEFYRLITEAKLDIIQPNASICGGITDRFRRAHGEMDSWRRRMGQGPEVDQTEIAKLAVKS